MFMDMEWFETMDDIRRRAPLAYWSRADNARFNARFLSQSAESPADSKLANYIGYKGIQRVSLYEGFIREAGLSLELILKAIIAQMNENGSHPDKSKTLPMIHDLPKLWDRSGLPAPSVDERKLLTHMKWNIQWAARYPAPTNLQARLNQDSELEKLGVPTAGNLSQLWQLDWESFDDVYTIAVEHFWGLRLKA